MVAGEEGKKLKVLIVEDESIVSMVIENSLVGFDYDVVGKAVTGDEAIQAANEYEPDIILMDIYLEGDMDGIEASRIINLKHDIPIVYLTAYSDRKTIQRALDTNPFGYLIKPFTPMELYATLEAVYNKFCYYKHVRDEEAKINALLSTARSSLIIIDEQGRIVSIHGVMEEISGKEIKEFLNSSFLDLVSEGVFSPKFRDEIEKVKGGETSQFEEEFKGKWLMHNIYPINTENGHITQIAIYTYDITNLKRKK